MICTSILNSLIWTGMAWKPHPPAPFSCASLHFMVKGIRSTFGQFDFELTAVITCLILKHCFKRWLKLLASSRTPENVVMWTLHNRFGKGLYEKKIFHRSGQLNWLLPNFKMVNHFCTGLLPGKNFHTTSCKLQAAFKPFFNATTIIMQHLDNLNSTQIKQEAAYFLWL